MDSAATDTALADPSAAGAEPLECSREEAMNTFRQLVVTFLKLQRRVEDMLAPHGLVLSQFEALAKIGFKPGMIQQELVSLLLVTKGNVGALLDRLESIGLVERQPDPNDRRANRLYLTAAGRQLMSTLMEKHKAFVREEMSPLHSDQLKTLESLLKAIEPPR